MSFGVHHLLKKQSVSEWYCLLEESTGRKKHLTAPHTFVEHQRCVVTEQDETEVPVDMNSSRHATSEETRTSDTTTTPRSLESQAAGLRSPTPRITFTTECLDESTKERQRRIRELVLLEETFVREVRSGVKVYIRPLQAILSNRDQELCTIFQNIEEIASYSDEHLHAMRDAQLAFGTQGVLNKQDGEDFFIEAIGEIYLARVQQVCESCALYCKGLSYALQLLALGLSTPQFAKHFTLQMRPSCDEGLGCVISFVLMPQSHVYSLLKCFQNIIECTESSHHDYDDLEDVVDTLHRWCQKITKSVISPCSGEERDYLDAKFESLRESIHLPQSLKNTEGLLSAKHFIFAGELEKTESGTKKKLWVILLNDVILMTQIGFQVTVVEEPIYLNQVLYWDFSTDESLDFKLTVSSTKVSETNRPAGSDNSLARELSFHCARTELYTVWCSYLQNCIITNSLDKVGPTSSMPASCLPKCMDVFCF